MPMGAVLHQIHVLLTVSLLGPYVWWDENTEQFHDILLSLIIAQREETLGPTVKRLAS